MKMNLKYSLLPFLLLLTFSSQAQIDLDFSHKRGFYNESVDLEILSEDQSVVIRYTLDGEEPTISDGMLYSGSINISTTTVVRAIGFVDGADTSKIYTHSYLYLEDVIQQTATIADWPNNTYSLGGSGSAQHDYEMDPNIVSSPLYSDDLIKGLTDIPSLSIVMPKSDFWTMYDGNAEMKTSIELLYAADPLMNEQEDAGIEPHSHDRLKRSMRLSFKKEYGAGKWESNIFRNSVLGTESATNTFDRIVLRGGNNRAWTRNWNEDRTAFTRDEWYRQSQIASSGIGSHGTFVHLYVNGLYWGIYNPVERPDESFSSSYLCGEKEDWFAVSHGGNQGGDNTRYNYMMNTILDNDLSLNENYTELKEYLDVSKFSDYVILSWMTGVQDWPGNNWWGGNSNNPAGPFMYFGWDNEWSWDVSNNSNNGAWVHPAFRSNDLNGQNSAKVFNRVKFNEDFMIAFADRVYKLCFNDGSMTDENSRARWNTLNSNIKDAVVAESARWGDAIDDGITRTRDVHWQNEVDRLDELMDGNVQQLMDALYEENYYPTIDPPLFQNTDVDIEVQELSIPNNYSINLVNPNSEGEIYYTLNGIDPRASGGELDPAAITFTDVAISIDHSLTLLARVKVGSEWSALHCLHLYVQSDLSMIKITEIMYNPIDFGAISSSDLEFLEIKNTSTSSIADLSGVRIFNGVKFDFPIGTKLEPQAFAVIASDTSALVQKCPGIEMIGEYKGQLRNSGEQIEFMNFVGDTIIQVKYDDELPWPIEADGDGHSLVSSKINPIGNQENPTDWIASFDDDCGSPGADDLLATSQKLTEEILSRIIVYPNPALTNSLLTIKSGKEIENIELFNLYGQKIPIRLVSQQNNKFELMGPVYSGMYIIRIHHADGKIQIRSIMIK
ncbi:chitobiase/beta-hexosaminidase C-terminal domain-containing protein [Saprospiraceae bacterium]|nr:chitobiase/beta-hexosaminidase C-terminal domain-containing protein [Saprospiraceae bacterium]